MADPKVDVRALAELARLEKEIPDILKFVEQIQNAAGEVKPTPPELRNVMREDKDPHESGLYTERLLKAAPKSENDRVVVKQVVSRKRTANSEKRTV